LKRLIVNADDFGLAGPVNLGIIKGHREGVVTSTSLLACGAAAEEAAALAKENPGLGVGVHLCLTLERTVLDPASLPTLTRDGRLPGSPFNFMRRFALGLIDKKEVEAELRAQVNKAFELGVRPTHLDGHQHVQMMPGVFPILMKLADEFGIPAVRFPVGPWRGRVGILRALEKSALETLSLMQAKRIKAHGLKRPDYFFGLPQTGILDMESLCDIISQLPEGTSEVMCHPGLRDDALAASLNWGRGWETELSAVTAESVRRCIRENRVELVNFSHLS
jgi:predicted glycoside hydrolase/deacetylase ChbG (UPF0249 family)